MRIFKDAAGRSWTIDINVDAIRRIRDVLNVNLVAADFIEVLERLLSDPVLLCDVIYVACKAEADALKLPAEDFGRAMAGDALAAAMDALLQAIADFTPHPKDRERMRKMIKELGALTDQMRDMTEAKLDAGLVKMRDPATLEAMLGEALRKATTGPISGASPAPLV